MEFGLSLGANLGDRLQHLVDARRRLAALPGITVCASSAIYETEPVDVGPAFREQAFFNAVVILAGAWQPAALAEALRGIEHDMGRVRGADRNAPRPIDLDVLYADGVELATPALTLPHPRWRARRFVVQPLAEVRPDLVLPGDARRISEILRSLPQRPDVVLWASRW